MLMVIFGAGASYDSSQEYRVRSPRGGGHGPFPPATEPRESEYDTWRPPLANELFLNRHHAFGDLVAKYGRLSHILPYLREPSGGRSVEEVLESLLADGGDYPERQREFASVRYYLCDLLSEVGRNWSSQTAGVTNYAPLVGELLRLNRSSEPICLVTFNYDLLLDAALYSFDFKMREPEEQFDSHPILKFFKLHGSVDWARMVDFPNEITLTPRHLIEQADALKLSSRYIRANATNYQHYAAYGSPIFPAIAIPTQTKSEATFECPPGHLTKLVELLRSVTKILIIGWQAKEAHFTRILREKLPPLEHICVVGRNSVDSQTILSSFLEAIGQKNNQITPYLGTGGFTYFILNHEGLAFLRA